jgi:transcription factor Ssl1
MYIKHFLIYFINSLNSIENVTRKILYITGLTLVSAPHLARSYHHLFPLDAFKEIPTDSNTVFGDM